MTVADFYDQLPIAGLEEFENYLKDIKFYLKLDLEVMLHGIKKETVLENFFISSEENAIAVMTPLSNTRLIVHNLVLNQLKMVNVALEFSEIDIDGVDEILDEMLTIEENN
ncbi:MAG: hypothetical protein U0V04_01660 [Spirosomataceae bacterium]